MFNHVTLEVQRDLMDAEIEWWCELLGFSEETPYSDKYGARWIYRIPALGAQREQIHLFPVPHNGMAEAHVQVPGHYAPHAIIPTYGHLAFVVGGLLEPIVIAAASYARQYNRPDPVEGTRYWGTRRFMIASPTGHRVEVMESGPLPEDQR